MDNGSVSSYRYAKEILDNLNVEYFLVCGNHDNFENLQKVFGDHKYFSDSKFSKYYIDFPNLRLVAMDTRVIGKEFEALCKDRLHWLELRLKETVKPIMIFLHHFPVEVDSSLFKDLNLLNSNELSEIISRYDSLLGLYCGHYHHSSVNKFAKKICWVSPSTAPTHILKGDGSIALDYVPPSYSVHIFKDPAHVESRIIKL